MGELQINISNINDDIGREFIISQEIIYIEGIPILFESYIDNGILVDIGSLLHYSEGVGYRVVRSDEEPPYYMPSNFMELLRLEHDRIVAVRQNEQSEGINYTATLGNFFPIITVYVILLFICIGLFVRFKIFSRP